MTTRLSVHTDFGHKKEVTLRRSDHLKRKAWMVILTSSAMFWVVIALMIVRGLWG